MDIESLRTFLEVKRTGHFGRAADNLFLTQSAVSARIRQLEDTLGTPLFYRQRNDIRLTPAGERLLRHAETIVGAWQRARMDADLDETYDTCVSVGGLFDLWNETLLDWLVRLRKAAPEIALHVSASPADVLYRELINGLLDLIFLFEVPVSSDLNSKFIRRMNLILVSSIPELSVERALATDFIVVNWGTAQAAGHARRFPNSPVPAVRMSHGSIAMAFLLREGGCAYLPEDWVSDHLVSERLFTVKDAPPVEREIHAVWRMDNEREAVIGHMMEHLHD